MPPRKGNHQQHTMAIKFTSNVEKACNWDNIGGASPDARALISIDSGLLNRLLDGPLVRLLVYCQCAG